MAGDTRAAEIAVSPGGGHVFAIERHGGLNPGGRVCTRGIRPRFFGLEPSGQRLFSAPTRQRPTPC